MDGWTSKTSKRDPAKTSMKTYSWRPFGDVFCSFVWGGTRRWPTLVKTEGFWTLDALDVWMSNHGKYRAFVENHGKYRGFSNCELLWLFVLWMSKTRVNIERLPKTMVNIEGSRIVNCYVCLYFGCREHPYIQTTKTIHNSDFSVQKGPSIHVRKTGFAR